MSGFVTPVSILIGRERGFDIFLTIRAGETMIPLRVEGEARFVEVARLGGRLVISHREPTICQSHINPMRNGDLAGIAYSGS